MRQLVRGLICVAGLAILGSTVGCQTYELGQTLPSPGIMRDDLQYFPKGLDFPLRNELNAQHAAEAERAAGNNR